MKAKHGLNGPELTRFSHVASQSDGVALDDTINVLLDECRSGRIYKSLKNGTLKCSKYLSRLIEVSNSSISTYTM